MCRVGADAMTPVTKEAAVLPLRRLRRHLPLAGEDH